MSSLFAGLAILGCLYCTLTALLAVCRTRQGAAPVPHVGEVAVLIPAYNEEAVIGDCLGALRASRLVPAEVLVIDDGSRDGTARVAAAALAGWPAARLIRVPENRGKAAALNAGLAAARSPLVLTLDADTLVAPDCIDWAVAAIAERDGVACNVRARASTWLAGLQAAEYVGLLNLERRAQALVGAITTMPGAATLWRRSALLALGGYSDRTLAEDTDITLTAQNRGLRLGLADRAIAVTVVPRDLAALLRQRGRWFWGNAVCALVHWPGASAPRRFRAISAVFALLNLGSVPFLMLSYCLAVGLLLRGQFDLAFGFGLLLTLAGGLRSAVGFFLDRQALPPPWVLLPSLVLLPIVIAAAAALRAPLRRGRDPAAWGRIAS